MMRTQTAKQNIRFLIVAMIAFAFQFSFIALESERNPAQSSGMRLVALWAQGAQSGSLPLPLAAEVGQSVTMKAVLPLIQFADCLIFRTENLAVSVAVSGQTLYHTTMPPPHTTQGDEWHMIPLPKGAAGETVSITSTRLYPEASLPIRMVYLGSQYQFLRTMLRGNMPSFLASILLVLMGISFLISTRILFTKDMKVETPWTFAMLSITLGVWSAMQSQVPELLVGSQSLWLRFFTYSPLPLAVAMGCFFLRTLPAQKWLMVLYLWLAILELIAFSVAIAGEGLRFAAYVETLPQARFALYIILVLFLFQLSALLKDVHAHFYILLGFICLVIMIFADIAFSNAGTYDYASNTRFGMLLMISLIALQYGAHARTSVKLADEADLMRRLAYRDPLTGLANRLALVRDQEQLLNNQHGCVGIVQMDINNLKEVNDRYGHEEGDCLILRAAQAIREAFAHWGTCYRVGGDEFVALLNDSACEATYQQCAAALQQACEKQSQHQTRPLSIALGFALYNPADGQRFYDFVRDADMSMYENKREMKARQSAEAEAPGAGDAQGEAYAAPDGSSAGDAGVHPSDNAPSPATESAKDEPDKP